MGEVMTGKSAHASALILGGGKGSRIGRDKKTLALHGVPVLGTLAAKLSSFFPEVFLSLNNTNAGTLDAADIAKIVSIAHINGNRVTLVQDVLGEGPLAGIYAGLCACSSDYLFVCACDMPFINLDFIRSVDALIEKDMERAAPKDIYLYRAAPKPGHKSAGYEPFNAFYRKSVALPAKAALEKQAYKLIPLIESLNLHALGEQDIARFGGETMFFNINRMEDLRYAEQLPVP